MKAFSSLRSRLVIVVLLSAGPALALLYATALENRARSKEMAENSASRLVRQVALDQKQALSSARQLVEAIARLPQVFLYKKKACNTVVAQAKTIYPLIASIGAIKPNGDVFCSALPFDAGLNAANSPWFKKALKTRDYAVSRFYTGRLTRRPVMTLAYPSFAVDGKLAAIVFVSTDLSWLNQILTQEQLPPGYVLTVIDPKGIVLARTPDPGFWVGDNHLDVPVISSILSRKQTGTFQSIGLDGRESLFASLPLQVGPDKPEAFAYVGIRNDVAYAEFDKIFYRNIVGLISVILIALLVATWGSDLIVLRRLRELVATTRKLATGDLSIRTNITSGGEVGQLASAFDDMADALEKEGEKTRESRNELQASQSMLSTILNSIPVRVFWKNKKLNYIGCNELFARDVKLETPNQVIGKNDYDLPWADQAKKYRANDLDVITSGIPKLLYEVVQTDANGNERWLEVSKIPLKDLDEQVIGVLGIYQDITPRKHVEKKLNHMAYHDGLTGLINRREFENRLRNILEKTHLEDQEHALLYIDLDQFKIINDTCGHFAGDELLKQLANILSGSVRHNDVLARLGGDEFGVILENCQSGRALIIAEEILNNVRNFKFVWKTKSFSVGASIGLVVLDASTPSMQELLSRADMACYAAKDLGRNRVHVYEEGNLDLQQRHGEMRWVGRINNAFELEQFRLYYQDIIPLQDTAALPHREILLRMVNDDGGVVLPATFIAAAERYGLMQRIDQWVISAVLIWLEKRCQQNETLDFGRVFINLSGTSLGDESFLTFIREKIREIAHLTRYLGFEITETSAIADFANAEKFISEVKKAGCQVALDDFGAGMSSFSYLRSLPVDFIKIDGSFVRTMLDDPMDMAIVRSINQVGHVANIKTIAEYVETAEVEQALAGMGIDYAQGFRISRAKPLDDL